MTRVPRRAPKSRSGTLATASMWSWERTRRAYIHADLRSHNSARAGILCAHCPAGTREARLRGRDRTRSVPGRTAGLDPRESLGRDCRDLVEGPGDRVGNGLIIADDDVGIYLHDRGRAVAQPPGNGVEAMPVSEKLAGNIVPQPMRMKMLTEHMTKLAYLARDAVRGDRERVPPSGKQPLRMMFGECLFDHRVRLVI